MDTNLFKEAMARVTGPVAVVTAHEGMTPHGTTVSSLASLSLDPPMISIALDNCSTLLEIVRRTGAFGVNVLAVNQPETAARFASRRDDRFSAVAWELDGGLPRFADSTAWLKCSVDTEVPAGDHALLLGTVEQCSTSDFPPLVYSLRTFGTHTALVDASNNASV
nr:flavin reductase family protein [Rhodococcus sp. (in: high G+C Gram-positive bacteria)]